MEKIKGSKQVVYKNISLVLQRLSLIVIAIVMVLALGGKFELASASTPNAKSEIQELANCYALGTDAIGRGNLQEGKNIYQNCFTPDATITAVFPSGASETRYGANNWADFVYAVFQANGYQATQHLIGTVNISVQNNKASMSSYLHATHKLSDTSIDVANGTYVDEVVNKQGSWKISRRTLTLIDFLNLSSPGASESDSSKSSAAVSNFSTAETSTNSLKQPHRPYIPLSNK
ncbi:nuclear transport factor 2 family protein [Nostoc sp. FACHB-152]|uniref:nuclear transport factor 2 family protein n=1 Tax=unclassified Nostoc TaxID=2593658 RepID=UPI00168631CC|nr:MULTISPECIES: nuclear transport factor 2 family protein [unclassified Nostoc]MBD2449154.1 nuclear transport factor 2 family protein [Nostoc sp. FACHB-152]MBD2470411.1 nuclear transport factor 2 family protein [Nostoc sp. FACHB-145]